MRKLLPVALLLAGCTLHQASAQKAPLPPSTVAATATAPTPTLHWAAAEFCEAYAHYYPTLPSLYRYNAGQALQRTPLAAPNADVAALLLQQQALRETVYQTLYQYCHTLKYGLDNNSEVEELLQQFLYQNLHMSDLAAGYLAPQIAHRYRQPAPVGLAEEVAIPATARGTRPVRKTPSVVYNPQRSTWGNTSQSPVTSDAEDEPAPARQSVPALYGAPGSRRHPTTSRNDSELSGWQLDFIPTIKIVDDNPGVARFRFEVTGNGTVESVTKVSGNVSPAQEKLCREALLNAHLVKITDEAGGATGYYNFRISVR